MRKAAHFQNVQTNLWHVSDAPERCKRLVSCFGPGNYVLRESVFLQAMEKLEPAEINAVLDGSLENVSCWCALEPGRSRCQHNFTFRDICDYRAQWFQRRDPVAETAAVLAAMPDNQGLAADGRVHFYLGERRVCREFFTKALGISKRTATKISFAVRGQPYTQGPTPARPKYNVKTPAYDTSMAFWRQFFGERAQTSGDGHRYFPVNQSLFYIYHNVFWPWHKDVIQHAWPDDDHDPDQDQMAPGADPALLRASAPETGAMTEEDVEAIFQRNLSQVDAPAPAAEEEISHEMSEEMKMLIEDKPDDLQSIIEAAVSEAEANALMRKLHKDAGLPSYATFLRALHDDEFKDVKKREKHFHCRCPTCADLQDKLRLATRSSGERQSFEAQLKRHHFEVKHWRALEASMHAMAKTRPDQVTALSYDDTSPFGFPRMTNRPIKGLSNYKVRLVPFNLTNHGTGENIYVYHVKDRWSKGGDRLCTILYNVIRRIKTKPDEKCNEIELAQKTSRKLVLMADNFAENKNNIVLDFCTELVMRGWYDEVEMLFGPVGHTHNGNDAVHYVHNNVVGNQVSITPGEFFENFRFAWHKDSTRPQPIVIDVQYAWSRRYEPVRNFISGFKNSGASKPEYVRAFRFKANEETKEVEMMIKGSPKDPIWYGQRSVPNGVGFQCLKGLPLDFPRDKAPNQVKMTHKALTGLNSLGIRHYCRNVQREPMHDVLMEMATTMQVPSLGVIDEEEFDALSPDSQRKLSGYTSIEKIGEPRCKTYIVPFIRSNPEVQTGAAFWSVGRLPGHGQGPILPRHLPGISVPMVTQASSRPRQRKRKQPAQSNKKTSKAKARRPLKPKRHGSSGSDSDSVEWLDDDASVNAEQGGEDGKDRFESKSNSKSSKAIARRPLKPSRHDSSASNSDSVEWLDDAPEDAIQGKDPYAFEDSDDLKHISDNELELPKTKSQNVSGRLPKAQQDMDSDDSGVCSPPPQATVPSEWAADIADAKLGGFAVMEVIYTPRGKPDTRGISVVQVDTLTSAKGG